MLRSSRSASDGRFDSATSLIPCCQYNGHNPSATPARPIDNEDTKPPVPYFGLKLTRPTKNVSVLPSRLPSASTSLYSRPYSSRRHNVVAPSPGLFFASPAYLSSNDNPSSASSDTVTSSTTDRLSCKVCGVVFTGKYRRGNCGRHMRQYHTHPVMASFKCFVGGCHKAFARQDARLKHQRVHHSELHPNSSTSPINLGDVPASIQSTLCNMRTKLEDETYTHLCDMFLYLFPRIVQYLRDTGSDTYDVYMDVLEEIITVVDASESDLVDSINQELADPALLDCSCHSGRAYSSKGKASVLNLGSSSVSRSDSSHQSRGQKLTHRRENGGHGHRVAKIQQNENPPSRRVDCPDHKHQRMELESQTSPCSGCRAPNMSQVRLHLKRAHHRGHSGTWMCPFCKRDFNHERSKDEHVEAKSCQTQVHSRGNIVKPWAMLYLTRHPEVQRIPSPYCDENTWLPQSVWEECRASLLDSLAPVQDTMLTVQDVSAPFLGRTEDSMGQQGREMTHGANNIPVDSHQAALRFANQLLISTALSMPNIPYATLAGSPTAGLDDGHQSHQTLLLNHIARRHSILLHNVTRYLASLARSLEFQVQGVLSLDTNQISSIANHAEMVVNNARIGSRFQSPHVHEPGQDGSSAASHMPAECIFGSSNIETSDLRSEQHVSTKDESFYTQPNDQYSTPTMSTRSSQTGIPTSTHLTQPSPATNPSSAHEPTGRALLSARNSPHHFRRWSGNSDVSECPISPPIQPDPQSVVGTDSQFEYPGSIEVETSPSFQIEDFIESDMFGQPLEYRDQHDDMWDVANDHSHL